MKLSLLVLASISLSACASTTPPQPLSQHTTPTAPTHTSVPPPKVATTQTVIDPRVSHVLQQKAFVSVMIRLRSLTNSPNQLNSMEKAVQIQQIQDRVLAQLSPNEFTLGRRYSTIFMMSGSISVAGLTVLRTHPNVARIVLNDMDTIHEAQPIILNNL